MGPNAQEFLIVLAAWIIAGIASAFFFMNRNASLKRRLWPPYVIGAAILFLMFVWWFLPNEAALYVAAPLLALVTFINLRVVKFCNACGATTQNLPFRPARFCAKCGAPLEQ